VNNMHIESMNLSDLIPYANNAKLHSAEQIKAIAASIKEFGFNNPILLDKDNGIIAGHGRCEAAKLLELDVVPCIKLGHLSDAQRRAYILADNRLAEIGSSWNMEIVMLELEQLKLEEFDTSLIGFDDIKLEKIGEESEKPEEKESKIKDEYMIIVSFDDELSQQTLWEQLKADGYNVRIP
jgi:ParB-like chromosome segregation protein Spo0J